MEYNSVLNQNMYNHLVGNNIQKYVNNMRIPSTSFILDKSNIVTNTLKSVGTFCYTKFSDQNIQNKFAILFFCCLFLFLIFRFIFCKCK